MTEPNETCNYPDLPAPCTGVALKGGRCLYHSNYGQRVEVDDIRLHRIGQRLREASGGEPADEGGEGPNPELMKRALSDRDARPWRYYKLSRESLMEGLDERVDHIATLEADLAAERERTRELVVAAHNTLDAANCCADCLRHAVMQTYDDGRLSLREALRAFDTEGEVE